MVLPAEENRQHPQELAVIVRFEIDDRSFLHHVADMITQAWITRSLMRHTTKQVYCRFNLSEPFFRAKK